jgi:hypothetical protein
MFAIGDGTPCILHVIGVDPVAVKTEVNGLSMLPRSVLGAVMLGGSPITIVNGAVADVPAPLVTVTLKL